MKQFYIRLLRDPTLFVGKQNSSYAIHSDFHLRERQKMSPSESIPDILQIDAHWFTKTHPKIFSTEQAVRTLLSRGLHGEEKKAEATFHEYEVVIMTSGGSKVVSATDFYHKRVS